MNITAITRENGQLVALVRAHISEHDRNKSCSSGPHATVRPEPGQMFHEMVAPEGHEKLSKAELRNWVVQQLAKQ
jgi:hypothetical protein